eukprot:403349866
MKRLPTHEEFNSSKNNNNDDEFNQESDLNSPNVTDKHTPVFEDVDDVLIACGGFGKFQYLSFTIIVTGMAAGAFILYNLYYFEKEPAYMCRYDEISPYDKCSKSKICDSTIPVHDWYIDFTNENSLHNWVEQLDLHCASDIAISFIGSSFYIGTFVGSFILPRASDVVGRRPMFLLGLVLYFCVIISLVFNKSLVLAYILLFFGGISETGRYYVAYVYCVEMMPTKYQNLSGLMIFVVFGCLQILFSIYFWFICKDWANLAYLGGILTIISFALTLWKLPETPRFFFSKKKFHEARKILLDIAEFNGKKDFKFFIFECESKSEGNRLISDSEISAKPSTEFKNGINILKDTTEFSSIEPEARLSEKQKIVQAELQLKGNLKELIQNPTYIKNLLIMTTIWSFGSFGFAFIPFYLDSLHGNTYLFAIFSGSAELLASLACILITRWITLKQSILVFCSITCAASFAIIFAFGSTDILVALLVLFNNFGITSTFDIAYLLNTEMFPTIFLGTAYGFCNIIGRFITIMSPIMAKIQHPYPMVFMVIFSGVSAVLSIFLKRMPAQKSE